MYLLNTGLSDESAFDESGSAAIVDDVTDTLSVIRQAESCDVLQIAESAQRVRLEALLHIC